MTSNIHPPGSAHLFDYDRPIIYPASSAHLFDYDRKLPAKSVEPVECTSYKGEYPPPRRLKPAQPAPWSLPEQSELCQTRYSRQSFRKSVRMIVHAFAVDFAAKASIALEAEATDAGDKKGKQATGKRSSAGRKKQAIEPAKGQGVKRKKGADDDDDGAYDDDEPTGGGGGSNVPVQKKSKGDTKGPPQWPEEQRSESKDTSADQRFTKLVSEILQSKDIGLKNARRIARNLKEVKLARRVAPFYPDRTEASLKDVLARQPVAGRAVRALSRAKSSKGGWVFRFAEGTSNAEAVDLRLSVPLVVLPANSIVSEQEQLHQELAKLYNSWPYDLATLKGGQAIKTMFIAVAVENTRSSPRQVREAYHSDSPIYQTKVHYVDSDTGAHEQVSVSASATEAAMLNVVVPSPMPTLSIYNSKSQTITAMTPNNPHHIAAPVKMKLGSKQKTSVKLQHTAEDAVYWIAAQLEGLVATKTRMKELVVMYRKQIGLQRADQEKEGIYGGEAHLSYVTFRRDTHTTVVRPSQKVGVDLGSTAKKVREYDLFIHSLNSSRATPVMETILQLFCAGTDLREVWLEAAKVADLVNLDIEDGVAPTSRCDCDEASASREMHICECCTSPVLCKLRSFDSSGRLVCQACSRRDQLRLADSKRPGETLASYMAHRSLWRNFKHECSIRGLDPESKASKAIFKAALEHVNKQLPGAGDVAKTLANMRTKYVDHWTAMTFDVAEERPLIGTNPSRRRYSPQGLTVDAVHRQGEPKNLHLKHSATNLVVTSNACQMAHGCFNPGVMHEIGEFKRNNPGPADEQSDVQRRALVQAMTDMATVNIKRRYINAGRGTASAKYRKIVAEAVAGRPTPNEPGPWDALSQQYTKQALTPWQSGGSENIWSDSTWARAQQCARSTASMFGVKLQLLPDGTLWIGQDYTTPANLDRNSLVVFLRERLLRLRVVCNKKWNTRDTDESLYQEIIFQYCCMHTTKPDLQWLKEKYGDRLALPFVLFWNSPLRLSIAHRLHGFGMFSGWPPKPTDVSERIKNDPENNMQMETWYVNSSKCDMAEDYYGDLDDILCKVKITDTAIYNPSIPQAVPDAMASTDEVPAEDEFVGASFDSLAAEADDVQEAVDNPDEDDGDEKMPDADEEAGDEQDDAELAAAIKASLEESGASYFSVPFAALYENINGNAKLQALLATDNEFRKSLARLQDIADNSADYSDAEAKFNEALDQVYSEFVAPNE